MRKELKVVAIVLVALIVFLGGFGLGATKGITIAVNVSGDATPAVANPQPSATEPTATQPPVTQPPVSEPAASEPASSQPAASEPASSQPAASEPAASEPAPSAAGVPSSKEEVVAKYNEVINAAKKEQNLTLHKTSKVGMECTDCSVSSLTGTVDKLLQNFMSDSDNTYVITNGADPDGRTLNRLIAPSERDCALNAANVASATAAAEGDGYTMTITINSEKSTFDGTNTTIPEGHNACLDPLNLATLELPMNAKITAADMTYPGATIKATVNGSGKLAKLVVALPLEGSGTGKLGLSLSLSIKGQMDDVYELTY